MTEIKFHKHTKQQSKFYVRFEVFPAVTMKNGVFWDVTLCGSCKNRRSDELTASFIRVTRIGELGPTLAVTRNISSQHASVASDS
jgi:hypothetical protein